MFNEWVHITGTEQGNPNLNNQIDSVRNGVEFDVSVKSNEGKTGPREVVKSDKGYRLNDSETTESLLGDVDFTSVIITNDEFSGSSSKPGHSRSRKGINYHFESRTLFSHVLFIKLE